ncbi:MAG: hypothetical protein K9G44_01595 [Melioribacteraceae bacterium]|nr:hypothetical protein [Melioribacteraceae bacterium]
MRNKLIVFTLAILFIIIGCGTEEKVETTQQMETPPSSEKPIHAFKVDEVIQSSSYTYVRGTDNGKETWLAITKQNVVEGETYYFTNSMEMNNFESKELGKTFESILFVDRLVERIGQTAQTPTSMHGKPDGGAMSDIKIEKAEGGVTIAELFSNKTKYENKDVTVKGKVVKYNAGIMDRNWVHIQDGTKSGQSFDLTITTEAEVKVGDIVTFSGNVTLDKDFGYGYKYDLLLENGVIK